MGVQITHTVTLVTNANLTLSELQQFVTTVSEQLGNCTITWTAVPGDQREPGSLTLTARPS